MKLCTLIRKICLFIGLFTYLITNITAKDNGGVDYSNPADFQSFIQNLEVTHRSQASGSSAAPVLRVFLL